MVWKASTKSALSTAVRSATRSPAEDINTELLCLVIHRLMGLVLVRILILVTKRLLFRDLNSDVAELFQVYGTKLRGSQNVRNLRSTYCIQRTQDKQFEATQ